MRFPQIPYYHIDSLIQSGGTAAVYRGVDLRSGREVAIKALFPNRAKDDFIVQRFREEANHYLALSRISRENKNIVELVDFVEHNDDLYLVMEFIDGTPLDNYLDTVTGPMPEEMLVPMFCRILDAISSLHQNGLLHLDIKPGNMMVLRDDNIKILDMGISAKINDKGNNLKKCGSPAFMAPEQINQKELGFYTDIFALGVTLFNMLTGKLPFFGEGHTEIFDKICNTPTPSVNQYHNTANPVFQPIIERALQKKGADRYQSCEEFKADLMKITEKQIKNKKNPIRNMKTITVGRDPGNTIVIDDGYVGRQHLELFYDDLGNIFLRDLGSKNGTYVNGKRIVQEVQLKKDDIVRIGNTILPWQYAATTIDIEEKKPGKKEKKPKEKKSSQKKNINWRGVIGVVTSILGLIMMLMYLLRLFNK